MSREGGCFCGAVRYRIEGSIQRVTHCHCRHCRRTSGAPFITWAECPSGDFAFTAGAPGECETRPQVSRTFCRDCGSQLTFRDAEDPGILDVTVATLDDPESVVPDDHVWCKRMLPWLAFDDGLPNYASGREARVEE